MAVGEWDQRQLCPDGGCVGVIGPDGTCKVCGRAAANWGDERKRGLIDPEDDDEEQEYVAGVGDEDDYDDEDYDNEGDDEAAPHLVVAVVSTAPNDWSVRRLCPDGACIGIIGLDGRCKVCGRTASGAGESASAALQVDGANFDAKLTDARPSDARPSDAKPTDTVPADAKPADAKSADEKPTDAEPAASGSAEPAAASTAAGVTAATTGIAGESPGASAGTPASAGPAISGSGSGDPESTLVPCSDPTCAGVTDRDGRCNVCGKVVA